MADTLTSMLDAHEGLVEKHRDAMCPFDLLGSVNKRVDEVLDTTMYGEGSHDTSDGDCFIYRRCGMTACSAECGIVVDADGFILDSARFVAPCTGKI